MKARGVKLRVVVGWMGLTLFLVSLPLGLVWKQQTYVRYARSLIQTKNERARLQNEVLLLETEVRGLKNPSRLELLARERFGLIDPVATVTVPLNISNNTPTPVEAGVPGGGKILTASWRERIAAWRPKGF